MKFFMEKNRYMAIISGKGRKRAFLYNKNMAETMLDAFWAFCFGNATTVKIYSCRKSRKLLMEFHSKKEWEECWKNKYSFANYFVWRNRY